MSFATKTTPTMVETKFGKGGKSKKKHEKQHRRSKHHGKKKHQVGSYYSDSSSSYSGEDGDYDNDYVDSELPPLIRPVNARFNIGPKNDGNEDGEDPNQPRSTDDTDLPPEPNREEGDDGIDRESPPKEEEEEGEDEKEGKEQEEEEEEEEDHMQMFPEKHLKELPQEEILALKRALTTYADRLKFEEPGGTNGKVTSEILTRLVLSFKSLLQGISWLISHVEQVKDAELKTAIVNDSDVWRAVTKIALRDPLLACGVNVLDPKLPTWDQIKTFLFYTEKGRRGLRVVSERTNEEIMTVANSNPNLKIDEENGYYYYLKQLISVHKDKFHNTSGRHYDFDVSNWNPSRENTHAEEMIHNVPIWSHMDLYANSFVGSYSNIGIRPSDETVVLAFKGRNFKRYNLLTGMDLNGCIDLILPIDCDFLSCESASLQTTKTYEIGNDNVNRVYDNVWSTCIAPATCRRHLKERIKSIPHCALFDWYQNDEKIKVVVRNPVPSGPSKSQVGGKRGKNACAALCDTIVVEKDVIDALYDECALDSKVCVAHLHVMKNGDVLCILEDNPASDFKRFYSSCKTGGCSSSSSSSSSFSNNGGNARFDDEKLTNRGFTVVWYRLDSASMCRCTVLGRFKFSDLQRTRTFVNGKTGSPYPVNVKKYATNEKVNVYPEFGTTGDCKFDVKNAPPLCPERPHAKTHLINRIVSAQVSSCSLGENETESIVREKPMGSRFSFAMLIDNVKLAPDGDDAEVQDEVWSMSIFLKETPELFVEGVVATRLNKEHVWGRTGNHNYVSSRVDRRTRTASGISSAVSASGTRTTAVVETGIAVNNGRTTVARRGFYDRKRARMDVSIVPERRNHPCSCYTLILSDFERKCQDDTLISSWSESFSAVSRSNVVSLMFDSATAGDRRSKLAPAPILPLATIRANVPTSSFEIREPVTHRTTLTVHRIPGPFSNVNPSLVIGPTVRNDSSYYSETTFRENNDRRSKVTGGPESLASEENQNEDYETSDTLPCVLVHRSRYRNRYRVDDEEEEEKGDASGSGGRNLSRRLDCLFAFDSWMPSNALTVFEKDRSSKENSENDIDYDVNFHYDKAWVCENLLIALSPASDGRTACIKVFKFDPSPFLGGSLTAKASARALASGTGNDTEADFEIESTENFFLLNSTHVKNPNAVDMNEFVGGRKGKLGDTFETSDHVVFLIKENPNASLLRLEKYAKRSMIESSDGKRTVYDPNRKKKRGGGGGGCKPHMESRTLRTVKIYSKIWDGEWINAEDRFAVSASHPSVSKSIGDTVFYDFDTTRVCTNPKCKKTGCSSFETKTPLINWYFCNQKCYDSFYEQSQ
jgi:hypothetical protein